MPTASSGTTSTGLPIRIEYETFGDRGRPALLLVAGWSVQMLAWDARLCGHLADKGLFVIRFDNRDCGLSTHLSDEVADLEGAMTALMAGDPMPPMPYHLSDMAGDGFAVLDALGVAGAHVAGASMGGMIAQTMAIERPDRVLSLVSIMSNTGEPEYGTAAPEVSAALSTPPPPERAAYGDHIVGIGRIIGSRTHFDPDAVRARALASFDRAFDPEGAIRQMGAVLSSPPRAERLRRLNVPTLVIHGRQDPLITLEAGERTAAIIPGARLVVLDEAGHDLPRPLWPEIVDAISGHVSRASKRSAWTRLRGFFTRGRRRRSG